MGKRGTKPKRALKVVEVGSRQQNPPKALPGMTDRARHLWKRIVNSLPPDHFNVADLPLLREYCEAYDRSVEAQKAINKDGAYIPSGSGSIKAHPAVAVKVAAAATMAQLGTKLGICRSARRGKLKDNQDKPKSKRSGLMFGGGKS